jgi:hypothetical protein
MVFWNVEADSIVYQAAPGTLNWCIGAIGGKHPGAYHEDRPQGIWEHHGTHVTPKSLFWQQLSDRLGIKFVSVKKPVSTIFTRREDNNNMATNTIDGDTSAIPGKN